MDGFIKKMALALARKPGMGKTVSFFLALLSFFFPKSIRKTSEYFVFAHPSGGTGHHLIVPSKYYPDLFAFAAKKDDFADLLHLFEEMRKNGFSLFICNFGERQEVGQVHFHCFSKGNESVFSSAVQAEWSGVKARVAKQSKIVCVPWTALERKTVFLRFLSETGTHFPTGGSVWFYR